MINSFLMGSRGISGIVGSAGNMSHRGAETVFGIRKPFGGAGPMKSDTYF